MVQVRHIYTHLQPFFKGVQLLTELFNFWKIMKLGYTFVTVISSSMKSWPSYSREPPDWTVNCFSACTLMYLVMKFESEEGNVFQAAH